jgi:hypothetical protein
MFADLVKVMRSIPEWDVIQGQRSWPPITTLKTPGGSNSRIYSEMLRRLLRGLYNSSELEDEFEFEDY